MKSDDLKFAVMAAVREEGGKKRLSCADALRIAAEHGVPPEEIGNICDEENIKIRTCQLGCF